MEGDLTEKVQASQNKLEQLASKIPGYAGYKKKEQRREADKLLRLQVAQRYEEQLSRLNEILYNLTMQGELRAIVLLERAVMKLQLLIDRIKTATYGYAGLFDAVKVDEDALDRLYDFDEAMLSGVDQVAEILDRLSAKVQGEEPTLAEANELITALESLNNTFSQRQDVILE
jgi:hypothetical protein